VNPEVEVDSRYAARESRRKVYNEKREITEGFQKEGVPRPVRTGRIAVRLQRVSPGVLRLCPECGFEPWKWQTECPRCHAGLQ
jgi:hypothetical protein